MFVDWPPEFLLDLLLTQISLSLKLPTQVDVSGTKSHEDVLNDFFQFNDKMRSHRLGFISPSIFSLSNDANWNNKLFFVPVGGGEWYRKEADHEQVAKEPEIGGNL